MRSRLGIAISAGTLDLVECGPAAEDGQSPHDHIPLYFIAAPSTAARRPSAERSSQAEHDRAAHINGDASDFSPMSDSIPAASAFLVPNPIESNPALTKSTAGDHQTKLREAMIEATTADGDAHSYRFCCRNLFVASDAL